MPRLSRDTQTCVHTQRHDDSMVSSLQAENAVLIEDNNRYKAKGMESVPASSAKARMQGSAGRTAGHHQPETAENRQGDVWSRSGIIHQVPAWTIGPLSLSGTTGVRRAGWAGELAAHSVHAVYRARPSRRRDGSRVDAARTQATLSCAPLGMRQSPVCFVWGWCFRSGRRSRR